MKIKVVAILAALFLGLGIAEADTCETDVSQDALVLTGYNPNMSWDWYSGHENDTVFINAEFDFSESTSENMSVLSAFPAYDSSDIFEKPLSDIPFPFPTVDWEHGTVNINYLRIIGPREEIIHAYSMGILYMDIEGFFDVSFQPMQGGGKVLVLTQNTSFSEEAFNACLAETEPAEDE